MSGSGSDGIDAVGASEASSATAGNRLGAHVSIAGGLENAPERAAALSSRDLQMFTKVPQRWQEPDLGEQDVMAFRRARERYGIRTVTVHASYLINNASSDLVLWERSLRSLVAELERCHRIGADHLVIHPGSATDGDRAAGIERNAHAIAQAILEVAPSVRVLLENTSGRGNILGARPAEMGELVRRIREAVGSASVVGTCFDSCHLFASGHDLRTDYAAAMQRWATSLDLEDVAVWHLNDSRGALGSGLDRHADIGEGEIGPGGFRAILSDPRWREIPMLIETPKEPDPLTADLRNLRRLRELARGPADGG